MHVSEIVLAGHCKRPVSQHPVTPTPLHADMLSAHASWDTRPLPSARPRTSQPRESWPPAPLGSLAPALHLVTPPRLRASEAAGCAAHKPRDSTQSQPPTPWCLPATRTCAQEWGTCSGLSQIVSYSSDGLASESKAVGFKFLFLTGKLSFLPIRLDMLVWGVWSFACTIKIHCACWDLRPRPREAPIPPRGHGSSQAAGGLQAGPGSRAQGLPWRALLVQDRCRFSLRGLRLLVRWGQLSVTPLPCAWLPGSCGVSTRGLPGISVGSTCQQGFPGAGVEESQRVSSSSLRPSPLSLQSHLVLLFSFRVFSFFTVAYCSNIKDKLEARRDKIRLCFRPGPEERKV